MKYTIFSIDNPTDWHQMAKFMRYVDTIRVLQKLKGNIIQCIGSWENKLEHSFICLSEDFEKFIIDSKYVDNQEYVLLVSQNKKQFAYLKNLKTEEITSIGRLRQVSKKEALSLPCWTYRPDLDLYYVACC